MPGSDLEIQDSTAYRLPVQPTPFIGREDEVKQACALLRRDEIRLVTFTGPGGTGKTRMGIEVASHLLDDFRNEVYFVRLAAITDPSLVITSIAQALGVMESGTRPLIESVKSHLRGKRILLFLDNFEQVLNAAPLVADIMTVSPGLKVLVTSRSGLHLRGEHEFPVPPLRSPDTKRLPPLESLTQYEAVRLFNERAVARMPAFVVDSDNAFAVAEICARLDGLPLAIELAAARSKILSPQAMLARLENRLKLLVGGEKDLPERQQTLRNTIAWSYDLLHEPERRLFRALSVFAGSCSFESIESVCEPAGDYDIDLLNGVASLVDKNLLRQTMGGAAGNETRFTMLETIQEYAREKLLEHGEADTLQQRHAEFFLAMAQRAETQLQGAQQVEWLNILEVEHDNFRSALKWASESGHAELALKLGATLLPFWQMRGHLTEGRTWLDGALAISGATTSAARARALMASGKLTIEQADFPRARAVLEEALGLFRRLDDDEGTSATLRHLGYEARLQGDFAKARNLLEEGLRVARIVGNSWDIAAFLGDLGIVSQTLGEEGSARALYEESLAIRRRLRDKRGIAMMLVNLGEVSRAGGDYDEAQILYEEGLGIARELGDQLGVGMVLHNLGHVANHKRQYEYAYDLFAQSLTIFYELRKKRDVAYCLAALGGVFGSLQQPERAARIFAAAQGLSNTISSHLDPADVVEYERNMSAVRSEISPDDWDDAWRQGQRMTLEEAVAYALDREPLYIQTGNGQPPRPRLTTQPLGEYPAGLTEREVAVLRLVATGMGDNQIADSLTISPRTVHRHLSSIFSKLNVTSRTAAARWAIDSKLVEV